MVFLSLRRILCPTCPDRSYKEHYQFVDPVYLGYSVWNEIWLRKLRPVTVRYMGCRTLSMQNLGIRTGQAEFKTGVTPYKVSYLCKEGCRTAVIK